MNQKQCHHVVLHILARGHQVSHFLSSKFEESCFQTTYNSFHMGNMMGRQTKFKLVKFVALVKNTSGFKNPVIYTTSDR